MKKFMLHGYYRVFGAVFCGLGILGCMIIAANTGYGDFDLVFFLTGTLLFIMFSLPFFAIDEHLDNQEIIQNQLEALAYEMHEANKRGISKGE